MKEGNFVQYGCGTCCPSDWRNFDASPILRLRKAPFVGEEIVCRGSDFPANAEFGNIVSGLPIPENFADAIYCPHVLEHLWRDECATALINTYRYLKPGGLFRLVVPDVSVLARAFVEGSDPEAGLTFVASLHMAQPDRPRGLVNFLRSIWGHSQHRWMWEYRGLEKYLRAAGFLEIREARIGDSKLAAFASVEDPSRYRYSLCIEARK